MSQQNAPFQSPSRQATLFLACGAWLLLSACDKSATVSENLPEGSIGGQVALLLDDSVGALEGAGEHPSLQAIDESLGLSDDTESGSAGKILAKSMAALAQEDDDWDTEAVGDFLDEVLFTKDNLRSSRDGNFIYEVPSSVACDDVDDAADRQRCERTFTDAKLRIRVREVHAGVDLTVLVGANDTAPLTFELRADRLSVVADIGQVDEALAAFGEVLPGSYAGIIALSLEKLGPKKVALSLEVREPVDIDAQADGESLQVHIDRAVPLARVAANAADKSLEAALDAGALSLRFEGEDGSAHVRVEAVTGHVFVREGTDAVSLSNLSLGGAPLSVDIDDRLALKLELNHDHGGVANLRLEPQSKDSVRVTIEPALQLSLFADGPALGDDPSADIVTLGLLAQNGDAPTVLGLTQDTVLVYAGNLELSAETVHESHLWSVKAGECVLNTEDDTFGVIESDMCVASP